jgi:hypothetical protein
LKGFLETKEKSGGICVNPQQKKKKTLVSESLWQKEDRYGFWRVFLYSD